jgi:hypothetical protein
MVNAKLLRGLGRSLGNAPRLRKLLRNLAP